MKSNKEVKVDHKGRWVNEEWEWCWEWSRVPRGRTGEELEELEATLGLTNSMKTFGCGSRMQMELLCHKGKSLMGRESRLLWQTTIWVATYFVWKNRNTRVFNRKSENSSRLFNEIQLKTFEWIYMRAKKWENQWEKWLTRPTECGVVRNKSVAGDSDG
ncbi:hypothetical protein Tco_0365772 [Tanacetum coccineum]